LRIIKNIIFVTLTIILSVTVFSLILQDISKNNDKAIFIESDLKNIKLIDFDNNHKNVLDILSNPSIFFFGFTNCPDVCPLTLTKLSLTLQKLKNKKKLQIYFVSLDPERDSPEILKNYLMSFNNEIVGLTSDYENLLKLTKVFDVKFNKRKTADNYTIDHSSTSLLLVNGKIFDKILFEDDLNTSMKKINSFIEYLN